MDFSSNLVTDIKFTFDEIVILANSLINAMEHCKEYLADPSLDKDVHSDISNDLTSFSEMYDKIAKYFSANGITISHKQIVE